jgi:hypothetical protein
VPSSVGSARTAGQGSAAKAIGVLQRSCLRKSKAERPCCQHVRRSDISSDCPRAPGQVELPPQTLRRITPKRGLNADFRRAKIGDTLRQTASVFPERRDGSVRRLSPVFFVPSGGTANLISGRDAAGNRSEAEKPALSVTRPRRSGVLAMRFSRELAGKRVTVESTRRNDHPVFS